MEKDIKKNGKKLIYTVIGIIIISLVLIGINKLLYSSEVMIALIGFRETWQLKHLKTNYICSTILTVIYILIMFNKKDFEKKEIWKSILCIEFLIALPALVSFFFQYR